jgi:hypothetical protein
VCVSVGMRSAVRTHRMPQSMSYNDDNGFVEMGDEGTMNNVNILDCHPMRRVTM